MPANAPLGHPYWLREEHTVGLFKVEPSTLIGRPENPPAFPVVHRFQVGGQTLEIADVPVQAATSGEPARILEVIAPVVLRPLSDVRLFAPGSEPPGRRRGHGRARRRGGHARPQGAGRMDGHARVAAVPDVVGRRPRETLVQRQGPVRTRHGRLHGRGPRGRPDLEHRPGRDPARSHPRPVAPAPRAAEGRDPRPGDQGPSRRLPPRRRRPGGRGPRGDGLRGHPARRRGPHPRETRPISTPW